MAVVVIFLFQHDIVLSALDKGPSDELDLKDPNANNWPDEFYSSLLYLGVRCTEQHKARRPFMDTV